MKSRKDRIGEPQIEHGLIAMEAGARIQGSGRGRNSRTIPFSGWRGALDVSRRLKDTIGKGRIEHGQGQTERQGDGETRRQGESADWGLRTVDRVSRFQFSFTGSARGQGKAEPGHERCGHAG